MTTSYSQPLITTVIPTYRRPTMLRRAIRSVLAQTYPNFRVCVYDNASGDETGAVVEEFRKSDSRVEYFCRAENIGMTPNFVDGAKRVKTPFFSFLSDDDLMLPHFLEVALSGFQRHPEAALSILPTLCMGPNGLISTVSNLQWPVGLVLPPCGMLCTLYFGNPGLQAMLIRKTIWDDFGGFDEATDPRGEYDFDLRVMARLPVVVSRKPGGIQVIHRGAFTVAGGLSWVWPSEPRMIEKLSQNVDLEPAVRLQAVEKLRMSLKRGLVTRGVARSLSLGRWEDAERAANLLVQECRQSRGARAIRWTTAACRRLPGVQIFLRAFFALRTSGKIVRNLHRQWQFRAYARLLRQSTLAATNSEFPSSVLSSDRIVGSLSEHGHLLKRGLD